MHSSMARLVHFDLAGLQNKVHGCVVHGHVQGRQLDRLCARNHGRIRWKGFPDVGGQPLINLPAKGLAF